MIMLRAATRPPTLFAAAAALALTVPAGAAPAVAAPASRTVRPGVVLVAYGVVADPADVLGLPGDVHGLALDHRDTARAWFHARLDLSAYDCPAGFDPAARAPEEEGTGCLSLEGAGADLSDPRSAVSAGPRVRVRGGTPWGALDLTASGGAPATWVSYEFREAEGTRVTHVRTTSTRSVGFAVTGHLAGLTVHQPPWVSGQGELETNRTVTTVGRGPRVPVPQLPAPGTEDGDWGVHARATADWRTSRPGPGGTRDLTLTHGEVTVEPSLSGAAATRYTYRCAPGQEPPSTTGPGSCATIEPTWNGSQDVSHAFSLRGRASGVSRLLRFPPDGPAPVLRTSWWGGAAVGFTSVEISRYDEQGRGMARFREGVRWRPVAASGTWDGARLGTPREATLSAWRERTGWTPEP